MPRKQTTATNFDERPKHGKRHDTELEGKIAREARKTGKTSSAAKTRRQAAPVELDIIEMQTGETTYHIIGKSPLVYNRMSQKVRGTLLFPSGRMTAAEKRVNLKHNPIEEYRSSVYRRADNENGPTRLLFPGAAFKRAMATVALTLPGVHKTDIDRLTWIADHRVDIYGVPTLFMDVVRSADKARTPDIHTWACLPEWCTSVTIRFVRPMLSTNLVSRLLGNAGKIIGIGDGRNEKGKRSFGAFEIVNADDPDYLRIMQDGVMQEQDAALYTDSPNFYDADSEDLFTWFEAEYTRRAQALKEGRFEEVEEESLLEEAAQ